MIFSTGCLAHVGRSGYPIGSRYPVGLGRPSGLGCLLGFAWPSVLTYRLYLMELFALAGYHSGIRRALVAGRSGWAELPMRTQLGYRVEMYPHSSAGFSPRWRPFSAPKRPGFLFDTIPYG